jgi:hypothetical protein
MDENNQHSEGFRTIPQTSASFGTVPQDAERFGTVPKISERTEQHTLSVREVARMFENAGVARTERSITNWCHRDRNGVSRLDAYYDENDRRYFITPQSVERAIQEELAKGRVENTARLVDAGDNDTSHDVKQATQPHTTQHEEEERIRELERKIIDLEFLNRGKDQYIDLLKDERKQFGEERKELVEKLVNSSRQIGTLETRLLQLEAPKSNTSYTSPASHEVREAITVPVRSLDAEQATTPDAERDAEYFS